MSGSSDLDDLLRAHDGDGGCEAGEPIMDQYVEIELRGGDPGERFPWSELAAAGVGHFVPPAPPQDGAFLAEGDRGEAVESLQSMLAVYGYGVEINGNFDRQTTEVVDVSCVAVDHDAASD